MGSDGIGRLSERSVNRASVAPVDCIALSSCLPKTDPKFTELWIPDSDVESSLSVGRNVVAPDNALAYRLDLLLQLRQGIVPSLVRETGPFRQLRKLGHVKHGLHSVRIQERSVVVYKLYWIGDVRRLVLRDVAYGISILRELLWHYPVLLLNSGCNIRLGIQYCLYLVCYRSSH